MFAELRDCMMILAMRAPSRTLCIQTLIYQAYQAVEQVRSVVLITAILPCTQYVRGQEIRE